MADRQKLSKIRPVSTKAALIILETKESIPMAIQAGLVGLPNVGKSTLFNALTKSNVLAENYPFATIDPHMAITNVPDQRLTALAKIFGSAKTLPTIVKFVDIAGLVKGASKGEGLGNQFLSNIMGVDLILHVLRVFDDKKITHVHNVIDPSDDFDTIMAELMIKDLESVEKRVEKLVGLLKQAKTKNTPIPQVKEWEREQLLFTAVKKFLEEGNWLEVQKLYAPAKQELTQLVDLLSAKNFLIIANVSEDEFCSQTFEQNTYFQNLVKRFGKDRVIPISAKIEAELAQLSDEEGVEMMESLGIPHKGLDAIIAQSYKYLNLITFFTCGPKEAHAWSIPKGTKIVDAAGEIHSDLQRGFICSDVYNCNDIFEHKTEQNVKLAGKMRVEGRDYVVTDGDIVHIRFNV